MKLPEKTLTEQEQIFIDSYCQSLNKSLAYQKAFGKSDDSTHMATRVIDRPHVYAAIRDRLQRNLDAEIAQAPNILLKYIEKYMELDPADYYDDDGKCKPMSELPIEARLLISNVTKIVNNRTGAIVMTYVLPDKSKLLDKLSYLVKFVAQVRTVIGDQLDMVGEAAKKRDEIFNKYKEKNVTTGFSVPGEIRIRGEADDEM